MVAKLFVYLWLNLVYLCYFFFWEEIFWRKDKRGAKWIVHTACLIRSKAQTLKVTFKCAFLKVFLTKFQSEYCILFRIVWALRIWNNICIIMQVKTWKLPKTLIKFYAILTFSSFWLSGLFFFCKKYQK